MLTGDSKVFFQHQGILHPLPDMHILVGGCGFGQCSYYMYSSWSYTGYISTWFSSFIVLIAKVRWKSTGIKPKMCDKDPAKTYFVLSMVSSWAPITQSDYATLLEINVQTCIIIRRGILCETFVGSFLVTKVAFWQRSNVHLRLNVVEPVSCLCRSPVQRL